MSQRLLVGRRLAAVAVEQRDRRALSLSNAVWRLKGVESTWAKCLLVAFRYTATGATGSATSGVFVMTGCI